MRQQRHTSAPSWQPSDDMAAPHRHYSEKTGKPPPRSDPFDTRWLELPPRPINQKVFQDKPPLPAVQRPAAVIALAGTHPCTKRPSLAQVAAPGERLGLKPVGRYFGTGKNQTTDDGPGIFLAACVRHIAASSGEAVRVVTGAVSSKRYSIFSSNILRVMASTAGNKKSRASSAYSASKPATARPSTSAT
jgi:hypothetical protein